MTLTRKLMLLLAFALLPVWAVIFAQLHFGVTANFQAFDAYTRDTLRQRVDSAINDHNLRLHGDSRYWMSENALAGQAGLAAFSNPPQEFPRQWLHESDVLSLVDLNGNIIWSTARNGAAWNADTIRSADGRLNPYLAQTDNALGQHFFLPAADGLQLAFATQVINHRSGATEGHLVAARKLDRFFYAGITPNDLSLEVLYSGGTATLASQLEPLLSRGGADADTLFEIEQATEHAYMRYDDAFGNPVLLLGAASPRFINTLPNNPGITMFWWITAITAVYVLLMAGVVRRILGEPLRRLRAQIRAMSLDGLADVDTSGKNEIIAIEEMFTALAEEREKRESSLRNFERAVEAADDAIAIIRVNGSILYVNPGYERLTGRSAAELKADKAWWKQVFGQFTMRPREADNEDEWAGELSIQRPDGEVRDVEVTTYKLENDAGNQPHFVIAMRDVTEKQAQITEIQRLATAVTSIEDCIIIADREGRILYANPAYEKRCGKTLAEMIGVETNKLSHAASPLAVYEDLNRTVLAGRIWRGELQAVFQDGRRVTDEAAISPITNEQGEIISYVTTLHDVTERVTMEEDLRLAKNRVQQANDELEERVAQRTEELRAAKDVAEQANVAKSAFLATVSHEIRTPLNGILGMLELLADYPLDGEQKRLLGSADTSANLLLALINDILDFSKIEAGELRLDETAVSLREVTESVTLALAATAHHKKLALKTSLDPNLPRNIMIDGVRLQQILLNLVGNAIKFTSSEKKSGVVSLDVDRGPELSGAPSLRLRVSDNGIGIPPEAMKTLFRPFTQAESSTTRRFGGTGLGLSISSRLAGLMGGEISVTSEMGEGSTFTLLLPLIKATDDSSTRLPRVSGRIARDTAKRWNEDRVRAHVLVAEDNRINQDVIKLQLKAIGFSCDLADDGEAALRLWHENDYDLVLTDCHMPNMDGFELAKAIRADEGAGQRTPIIALTANVLSEEAESCREAGMDECLTKPIERSRLDKALTVHITAQAVRDIRENDGQPPVFINATGRKKSTAAPTRLATRTPKGLLDMSVFAANIGDDRGVQCELLRRFASEAERNLADNRAALTAEDADTLKCNAHKLKSAARTIGAERLAAVCVEIEQAAEAGDFLLLTELLEQKAMLITLLGQQISEEVARVKDSSAVETET